MATAVQELNGDEATENEGGGGESGVDSKNFAAMRRKMDKLEKENAELRQRDMRSQATTAGFGSSKLLDIVIDRYMAENDAFELEAFTAFASEVGFQATPATGEGATTDTGTGATTSATDPNSVEGQIAGMQNVGDLLRGASTPPQQKDLIDQASEALANGDIKTSIALKSQQLKGLPKTG